MGATPKDVKKDWGLGGLLLTRDIPNGKKAGTMLWGGAPNLLWVRQLHSNVRVQPLPLDTDDCSGAIVKRVFAAYLHPKSGHQAMRNLWSYT